MYFIIFMVKYVDLQPINSPLTFSDIDIETYFQ